MGLIVQAAILTDMPIQHLARTLGPIYSYKGLYITQPFPSVETLKMMLGTVQARAERYGYQEFGARILPYGAKPPLERTKYKICGPLKCKLDYGTKFYPRNYDEFPPNQLFYDRHASCVQAGANDIFIPPNQHYLRGLKQSDVINYYRVVGPAILQAYATQQMSGTVSVRIDDRTVMRRHAGRTISAMCVDASALTRLNRGRTLEFYFTAKDQTNMVWLEVEPQINFSWHDTKVITSELVREVNNITNFDIKSVEVRYSGNQGFHVIGHLMHSVNIQEAHTLMSQLIARYVAQRNDERLTTTATHIDNSVCINANTMQYAGGLRMPYSLAYPTGLVCLPIEHDQIIKFEKEWATIPNVLAHLQIDIQGDLTQSLTSEETSAFQKWLGMVSGKLTPQDVQTIVKVYNQFNAQYTSDDPAAGERAFIQLIQGITGDESWTSDRVFSAIDALRWLSESPKYQGQEDTGNGTLPPLLIPLEEIAERTQGGAEIEHLPTELVDLILDLPGRISPNEIQRHIKVMLGFEVPLTKLNEFMTALKMIRGKMPSGQSIINDPQTG